MLFESACVDGFDTTFNTIDGDLGWGKPHDRSKSLMGSLDGPVVLTQETLPEHPSRRYWRCPVRIWDLGQWREEDGIHNTFI